MTKRTNSVGGGMVFVSLCLIAAFLCAFTAPAVQADEVFNFDDTWGTAGFNVVDQKNNDVELIFSVPQIQLADIDINGEAMQNVLMPGVILPNNAGAPNLPGMGRFIAIPEGASVEVEILEVQTEIINDVNVAPSFVIPREDDDSPLKYFKDEDIYGVDAYYPEEPVMVSDVTQLRGVDVVTVGITPFQYNPVTKELVVYTNIKVRVNFIGGNGHFGEDRLRSRWWEPMLQEHLLNYASLPKIDFDHRTPTDEDNVEYLIIVPDDPYFIAWADTLKRWRNEQGILTGITTLTEIGGNNATLIENYINNAYANWDPAPAAVLLLSDYQNSGDNYGITAPTWNNYCASDNIYADITGNNLPDIAFARICAQGYQQLSTMIGKMMDYERNPYTDPGFYDHPVIAGGWQTERWFILCCEVIYGYFANVQGKTPTREYAIYSGSPGSSWSTNANTWMIVDYFGPSGLGYIPASPSYLTDWGGNATRINNDLNTGAFILQHRDHGSNYGWGEPDYQISDLSGLNNDMYTYVFSINCLTGEFNLSSECFAEAFHRMEHGALGITAATETSYSFVNDTYVWGSYDAMWPDFDPGYGQPSNSLYSQRPCFGNASGKWYLAASSWPYNPGDKTVTYYLFHHHGDAFMTLYSEVPQNLNVLHDAAIMGGQSDFTVTADAGALIGLSVDGEYLASSLSNGGPTTMSFDPQMPGTTIRVTVTKPNYYRYISDVPVVPASGPYVSFNSMTLNDAVVGNNNGQWDFSENVNLSIEVINIGVATANNVDVTITTDHPEITVVDGAENYGNIAAGDSTLIADGFEVQSSANIVDGELVTFSLTATDGINVWESYFAVEIYAPEVTMDNIVIDDPTGNNNGALDPGETADLNLTLLNGGHTTAGNVVLTLTNDNPDVTISGSPANYGDITAAGTAMQTFQLVADPGMANGVVVTFTMDIVADDGYTSTENFDILVGDERNLPSGPDAYGYLAWDDNDGGLGSQLDWLEIAPAAGGPGTLTGLTNDDQIINFNLPFNFSFYGVNYSSVSISTNGFLCLGTETASSYSNYGIPSSSGPGKIVAAFWDDMYPPSGGQIAIYNNTTNHTYIAEWYEVPLYRDHAKLETFQVVLYDPAYYPTATGDGIIMVQYNDIEDVTSATFGIENQDETIGIQYGYNSTWDVNAWEVENGRTITYTTGEGGTPEFTVDLTYVSGSPVPVGGGNVYYDLFAENIGTSAANFDGWLDVSYEGGPPTAVVLRSFVAFQPGWTINRPNTYFPVPAAYAAGNYVFGGHIGEYPNVVWVEDSFPFVKSGNFSGEFVPFVPDGVPDPFEFIDKGDMTELLPENYEILGSYPNPFNPTATISYALPEAGKVTLNIYDISGRMVAQLVDGYRQAGYHEAQFEASGMASGVYIYQLKVNDFTANGKMILMK